MLLQLALMYIDRLVSGFIPWLDVLPLSTNLLPIRQLVNSFIRVGVASLIYLIVC